MPSPFPGMNPYFEQPDRWPGFQLEFIAQLRRKLVAQVPADYVVDVEEHIDIQCSVGSSVGRGSRSGPSA